MLGLRASQEKQDIWTFMGISYRSVATRWNSWELLQGHTARFICNPPKERRVYSVTSGGLPHTSLLRELADKRAWRGLRRESVLKLRFVPAPVLKPHTHRWGLGASGAQAPQGGVREGLTIHAGFTGLSAPVSYCLSLVYKLSPL